jgi:hypothetical protein
VFLLHRHNSEKHEPHGARLQKGQPSRKAMSPPVTPR